MTHTLLIWEIVPDDIKLYLIPNDVADKYRDILQKAHGTHINIESENESTLKLSILLSKEEYEGGEQGNEELHGMLAEYLCQGDDPLTNQHITAVYRSGFIM